MPKIPRKNLVATIKDVKADGVDGGTFTSGDWRTRDLNTLNDPDGIVTSLSSNQFTLPAGKYLIEAYPPALEVTSHKSRLYNVTDLAIQTDNNGDDIFGESAFSSAAASVAYATTSSVIKAEFTITSQKTFEIQHQCVSTQATFGFGNNDQMTLGDEIYTQVKITLLREGI